VSLHKLNNYLFEAPTINEMFWHLFFGAFFLILPELWKRITPKKQYMIAMILIYTIIALPLLGTYLVLQQYVGYIMGSGIISLIFIFLWGIHKEGPLRKFITNSVTSRTLYKNITTRKGNSCSYDDSRTRDITKPKNKIYESASAPCERCGSTDFEFRRLHF
jgi:hypothetical protein